MTTITTPFCGHCGYDFVAKNVGDPNWCDSCGADLALSIDPALLAVPTVFGAVGGSLAVTFTWTDNVGADSTDFRHQTDGGPWTTVIGDTSTTVVVAAEGEVVAGQVRSVVDGVNGPWSASASDTATA